MYISNNQLKPLSNYTKLKQINNNDYITISSTNPPWFYVRTLHTAADKVEGTIRHFPHASKEWKDSVYNYNKSQLKSLPVKHNLIHRIIKNHFYISDQTDIARSYRMRNLMRKSTTNKIFVSNPEIKHNNDKVIITIYTYDRERQSFIRRLISFNRKYPLYTSWINEGKKITEFNKLWIVNRESKKLNVTRERRHMLKNKPKTSSLKFKKSKRFSKRFSPYFRKNLINEIDFFRYKTLNIYKKLFHLDNSSLYIFLSYILSLFNIKLLSPLDFLNEKKKERYIRMDKRSGKKKTIWMKDLNYAIKDSKKMFFNILKKKPKLILWISTKHNSLYMVKIRDFKLNLLHSIASEYKKKSVKNETLYRQQLLNYYLWKFIQDSLVNTNAITNSQISYLYKIFKYNNYKTTISKFFKKNSKVLRNYAKLQLNTFKFNRLLPNLKRLMNTVYNKNIDLNVVNLKYINLNSDIYTQAIVLKLKKKLSLLKVLRKSLKLVTLPSEYSFINKDIHNFNTFKSLNINNLANNVASDKDNLNTVLDRLFPYNFINRNANYTHKKAKSKIISVLNTIKFKWTSGVRLEAAGRLTRRYTAARAAFKIKYKGNLKGEDNYMKNLLKSNSTIKLRNYVRSNSQYTFINSKRRIGSFGIKTWISSY